MTLSEEEKERYSRHIRIENFGEESQLKLKKGELLTLMGQEPEAEIAMFSIKDFSITPTGQTWREYLQTRR